MNTNKNEEFKKPEFIYIGESEEEIVDEGYEQQRLFGALEDMHKAKFPVGLRVLAFFGSILCLVVAAIGAVASIVWFIFSLLTFFSVDWIYASCKRSFSLFKKMLVISLGMMIGVFMPPMGIGFVVMYFMMSGEKINQSYMAKMSSRFEPRN